LSSVLPSSGNGAPASNGQAPVNAIPGLGSGADKAPAGEAAPAKGQ
jgi:hypothetical protein